MENRSAEEDVKVPGFKCLKTTLIALNLVGIAIMSLIIISVVFLSRNDNYRNEGNFEFILNFLNI